MLLPALTGWLVVRVLVLGAVLRLRPVDSDTPQGVLDPLLAHGDGLVGRVAALGYGGVVRPVDGSAYADTALLPLQPALVRLAAAATGTELEPAALDELSLALAFLASLAAAAAVCVLTQSVYGPRAALVTTWLWAALPAGASLWTPAPYAVLAACSIGALVAWSAGRPLPAGGLAGAASLADPVGLGAVAAVLTGVVARAYRRSDDRRPLLWSAGLAVGPPLAYAAWLARRRGSPEAALTLLRARGEADDGGRVVREQVMSLVGSPAVVLLALLLVAVASGLVLAVADRQPLELVVHTAVTVLVAGLTAPGLAAASALLLSAVGVWMPLGDALAARRRVVQAAVVVVLLLTAFAWTAGGSTGSPWS